MGRGSRTQVRGTRSHKVENVASPNSRCQKGLRVGCRSSANASFSSKAGLKGGVTATRFFFALYITSSDFGTFFRSNSSKKR